LHRLPRPGWLWAVHCETSTGVLNDLPALKRLCRRFGVDLYMDCVSSIGAIDVDLTGVRLASCVSGKALGSLPGISAILVNGPIAAGRDRSPRYLDLDLYLSGVPFTTSSNLVAALAAALRTSEPDRYQRIVQASRRLRHKLNDSGVAILADEASAAPHVLTIPVPAGIDSVQFAEDLAERGLIVACASSYLVERNWIQVCLMGRFTIAALDRLAAELCRTLRCVRAA
jgi:aspartate aminotransferase-like enzyme